MIKRIVEFIFEIRILKYIRRAGLHFLKGPIDENLAEHNFYVTMLAWILGKLERTDIERTIKMALVHDIAETRVGERNLVCKFYTKTPDEVKIVEEMIRGLEMEEAGKLVKEYKLSGTLESQVVWDADVLAEMLMEKDCLDLGNKNAQKWLDASVERLKTKSGKQIGRQLLDVDADDWWLKIVKKNIGKVEFFK